MPEEELAGPGGRAATEAALEEAAVALLRRDGVLAGLNLREVADEAGVNRGLVYHYFGSRGNLLRKALRRRGETGLQKLRALQPSPFVERQLRFVQTLLDDPEPVMLRTLLLLDRTEHLTMMPLKGNTQARLREAVKTGELDPDLDRMALHAFLVTSVYGYVLYREAFAAELDVDIASLDADYVELYKRIMGCLRPSGEERRSSDPGEPGSAT